MTTARQIKYLKKVKQFKKSEEESVKYKSFLDMGNNQDKAIYRKVPVSRKDKADKSRSKFQHPWLSKRPVVAEEIISSEAFRILLGDQLSPKYRVCLGRRKPDKTMTRLLDNFTPWVTQSREMADVPDSEASIYNYRGNPSSQYGKRVLRYLKTTSELENFDQMMAVSLLFGKDDLHGGNWGIVEIDGKKYAATVDHEHALRSGFDLYNLMYHYGHRKERLLTPEFVSACRQVAADYESKREEIKQAMAQCIAALDPKMVSWMLSIHSIMNTLDSNKKDLLSLSYQIEAEMAIKNGDVAAFREALVNLPLRYFPDKIDGRIRSLIVSMQNYRDGFNNPSGINLREFIRLRNFDNCDRLIGQIDYDKDCNMVLGEEISVTDPDDVKLESELLAVFDAVAKEKRDDKEHVASYRP